ncbi:MAG: lipoate--protein ligase [Thermacetogeniaceae bacterium]
MKSTWRLLDTGALPAAHNMALEKVILTARSRGWVPDTLHFLAFSPPAALVGYHQAVELEVEEDYCRSHGIEINRRISGGGAIYMDDGVLGWEIFALKGKPYIPAKLEEMYRLFCESAVAGLAMLGVRARYRPLNDIEVDGRKISGTGGTEIGDAVLFHGTVLVDFDVDTMIRCLKLPVKKLEDKQVQSFKERVTSLREVLGFLPPLSEVKKAMAEGFSEVLGIALEPGELSDREREMLERELPYFQSEEWIRGQRAYHQDSRLKTVDHKAPGGLIRVSLLHDRERRRIKSVMITGDFFACPERSILDFEAYLKNASTKPEELRQRVMSFFEERRVNIPGIRPEDFYEAIWAAVSGREERLPGDAAGCGAAR